MKENNFFLMDETEVRSLVTSKTKLQLEILFDILRCFRKYELSKPGDYESLKDRSQYYFLSNTLTIVAEELKKREVN